MGGGLYIDTPPTVSFIPQIPQTVSFALGMNYLLDF